MNLSFTWLPLPATGAAVAAIAVLTVMALGLARHLSALGQKPAPVLRNL